MTQAAAKWALGGGVDTMPAAWCVVAAVQSADVACYLAMMTILDCQHLD